MERYITRSVEDNATVMLFATVVCRKNLVGSKTLKECCKRWDKFARMEG